ncbi:MAG: peptidase, partial [Caulobacteraceae bacterium]|nr:peptidase [Caulobacteraceae bacterium]
MTDRPIPPVAKVEPLSHEQLGRRRTDDYAWMKDDNWREVLRDPSAIKRDVKNHLEAENAYAKAMLAPTEALQAAMFQEMKGRIKEDDSSAPTPDGPWEYYVRYEPGAQHPVHARRPRGSSDGEQALLDADAEARGKAFFQVVGAEHSPDHALYAYAVDEQGSEVCRIYVKDLATGELLPEPVESGAGDFVFSPCSQWLFWIWRDADGRPAKLYRRPARGSDDTLVYEEEDDGFFMGVSVTASRAYIALGLGNQETSEARLIPACDPTLDPFVVEPRTEGLRYEVEHWADAGGKSHFVIRTNADGAVDFKLVLANEADPSRRTWRDLVPHEPGRFIVGLTAFRGHLARLERVNANNRIVITEAGTLAEHAIDFDEEAYALGLEGGYEYDTPSLRFVYQSPTTPRQWFDYDMTTRRRTLRKTQEIPSGHDPAAYVTRRLYAPASDGAQVPITVLMKAGTPLDGSAPLLLYGYGSYGAA